MLAASAGLDGRRCGRAMQEPLLAELRAVGLLHLDRIAVDASHVHALKGESHRALAGQR